MRMRDKILGLAHFLDPVFPQKLALLSDKIWGCGYHTALSIIKHEIKKDVITIMPGTSRIFFVGSNPPEEDPIIRKFIDNENIDEIMKIVEQNEHFSF